MASNTVPLAVPDDLYADVKSTATETHLSLADVMRQSMKLGLPRLRDQLRTESGLKPFTEAECAAAFGADSEFDFLEQARAVRSRKPPEAD